MADSAGRKIRLALIITELDVGGAERCVTNLACGLDRDRFDPAVYALGPPPPEHQNQLVKQLAEHCVPVSFVGARSPWDVLAAGRRLRRELADRQPDIAQTFLFHANVLGASAARRAGCPRVALGMRVEDPARWRQLLERYSARLADRVVCVSRSVAEFAAQTAGLPRSKLEVIPNGIELRGYPAQEAADLSQFGIPKGRRALLFVGRLHRQKAVDWLLEMAPDILGQLPRHDLLLVGDGPQRKELQALARSRGILQRVHFGGWREDVPEILRACDLLLLPSRWEGMPNVVLEAMGSELPVLATRVAGVAEILGPLSDQQTVAFGDAAAFVSQAVSLGQDACLASQLGQKNRARVEQHFSLQSMVTAYRRLYEAMISPVGRGREK